MNLHHDDGAPPSYESSDARMRPLLGSAVLLVVVIAGSFLVGSWLLGGLENQRAEETLDNPLASYQARPQEAVLQAQPKDEMEAYRAEIEAVATTYGWIDEPNGVVRVPIERALELTLERGLPTRANPVLLER